MNPSIDSSRAIVAIQHLARQLNDLIAQDKLDSAVYVVLSIQNWAEDLAAELTRMKESK